MRDSRFVAEHRGGVLSLSDHRSLIKWAIGCVLHAIDVLELELCDERITQAISIGQTWARGECSVGEARKAAIAAHTAARECADVVMKNLARAAGHAVATAHMADHAPDAAAYVLKACKEVGGKELVEEELTWQQSQLPYGIREVVLDAYARVLVMVK